MLYEIGFRSGARVRIDAPPGLAMRIAEGMKANMSAATHWYVEDERFLCSSQIDYLTPIPERVEHASGIVSQPKPWEDD